MSHVSADLEYFQCDVCGTYFHKDIFVPHRRECNGLHSTELKRSEIKAIHDDLSRETRELVTAREKESLSPAAHEGVSAHPPCQSGVAPSLHTHVLLSTDAMERRQADRVRTELSELHYGKESERFRQLADPARQAELMAFLNT